MKVFSYIAVEGVTGSGKTEMAMLLARRLNSRLILEEVADNPFLRKFYDDVLHYRFQTQICFLLNRFKQLQEVYQVDLFHQGVLSDYHFAKDKIFAYLHLDDDELAMYEKLVAVLETKIPKPDLVVYLQAKERTILQRIRKRDRYFERGISQEYVQSLIEAYSHFFLHHRESPVFVVDSSDMDIFRREDVFEKLIESLLIHESGLHYFHP